MTSTQSDPDVAVGDGIAAIAVGDVLVTLWQGSATFERWRGFVMPRIDRIVAANPGGFVLVQLVLPSSGPPDAKTRAALQSDIRALQHSLRKVVTVALGDSFRQKIVRTIVRAMLLVGGLSKQQVVAATVEEGLALAGPESALPDLRAAVDQLNRALGVG